VTIVRGLPVSVGLLLQPTWRPVISSHGRELIAVRRPLVYPGQLLVPLCRSAVCFFGAAQHILSTLPREVHRLPRRSLTSG
jgi:hypothetical protein